VNARARRVLAAVIDGQPLYVADCYDLVEDGELLDGPPCSCGNRSFIYSSVVNGLVCYPHPEHPELVACGTVYVIGWRPRSEVTGTRPPHETDEPCVS
jgi:hypothetical protein